MMYIYVVILQEGDPFGTQLPDTFVFKNSYWHYCQAYLLNSSLLGISYHGCVKDILRILGYKNFYVNLGFGLFKSTQTHRYAGVYLSWDAGATCEVGLGTGLCQVYLTWLSVLISHCFLGALHEMPSRHMDPPP